MCRNSSLDQPTHNPKRNTPQQPQGPGQATEVSVNKEGWSDKK